MKTFSIDMAVEVPDTVTEDEITDKFIAFIESNGWTCGGGIHEMPDESEIVKVDPSDSRHVDFDER